MRQIKSHIGLRGIAAILVIFYHLHFTKPHLNFEDITALFQRSYLMVDLFFILSGFVISYVYVPTSGRLAWSGFMAKRVFRLYPLHLFCLTYLAIGLTVLWIGLRMVGGNSASPWTPVSVIQFLSQLLLINAYMPFPNGWNIPSWSISAELFAYAMFPLGAGWLRNSLRIPLLIAAMALGFYAAIAMTTGSLDITYLVAPARCLAGFGLGTLIYRYQDFITTLPRTVTTLGQAVAVTAMILILCLPVNDVLAIPAFATIVALTISDRGWLSRMLSHRVFQYLGEISYSVYLNHCCLIALLYRPWLIVTKRLSLDPGAERTGYILLILTAVLIVSHFTHRRIELPAQRSLNRWYAGRRSKRLPQTGTSV